MKLLQKVQKKDPEKAAAIEARANDKWAGHEDARRVFPIPCPIIIIGTKYDQIADQESEKLKWICRGLRFFAHQNNADLVFSHTKEKGFGELRSMARDYLFTSDEARAVKLQTEHTRMLSVKSGQDKLTKIGEPQNPGSMDMTQAWIHCVESYFNNGKEIEEKDRSQQIALLAKSVVKYPEQKVDSMRQQKDQELDRYRKEKESEKRFQANRKARAGGKKLVVKNIKKKKPTGEGISPTKPREAKEEMPPLN